MSKEALKLLEACSLTEGYAGAPADRIDRDAQVIRGVKIVGRFSTNKRGGKRIRYSDSFLEGARKLYEGATVNVDHPMDQQGNLLPGKQRSYLEAFGDLRNVHVVTSGTEAEQGAFGDLHYKAAHPAANLVLEDAERAPHRVNLSHNAQANGSQGEQFYEVTEALSVRSVDIVPRGGTVTTFFESEQDEPQEADVDLKTLTNAQIREVLEHASADAIKGCEDLLEGPLGLKAAKRELKISQLCEASGLKAEDQSETFKASLKHMPDDLLEAAIKERAELVKAKPADPANVTESGGFTPPVQRPRKPEQPKGGKIDFTKSAPSLDEFMEAASSDVR